MLGGMVKPVVEEVEEVGEVSKLQVDVVVPAKDPDTHSVRVHERKRRQFSQYSDC